MNKTNGKQVFLFDGRGWWMEINDEGELDRYLDAIWAIRKEQVAVSEQKEREGCHPVGEIPSVAHMMSRFLYKDKNEYLEQLEKDNRAGMKEALDKYGVLYVNRKGGWNTKGPEAIKRHEKYGFDFPVLAKEDIEIKQWTAVGGKHFYAYVGGIEVKDEKGNIKWDTEKEARSAAMKYVTKTCI